MATCPKTEKKDCPVCGRWIGWLDLERPGRLPSYEEWVDCKKLMQQRHDDNVTKWRNSLALVPMQKIIRENYV